MKGRWRFTVSEALLSENSLALQYSVQKPDGCAAVHWRAARLLDGALPDAVGTGSAPYEQAIFPAGQSGTGVWQETFAGAPLELTTHTLELQLDIYRVPEGAPSSQAMRRPVEETYTFLETARVAFPITARALETRTALHDGQPLEFAFDGYSLCVTRAEISATGAAFEWFLVFDSHEAALAHNCAWDKHDPDAGYWDYRLEPGRRHGLARHGQRRRARSARSTGSGEWAWRFAWYYTGLNAHAGSLCTYALLCGRGRRTMPGRKCGSRYALSGAGKGKYLLCKKCRLRGLLIRPRRRMFVVGCQSLRHGCAAPPFHQFNMVASLRAQSALAMFPVSLGLLRPVSATGGGLRAPPFPFGKKGGFWAVLLPAAYH